jgi:nitronate monooxygenase
MPILKELFPWTSSPLIVNAPMAGFAGGALASAVTLAGGLGLIGGLFDAADIRKELRIASKAIATSATLSSSTTLPVGVGFLPFIVKLEDCLPVVEEYKPAVVWLFAAKELDHYAEWTAALRNVSPASQIWVQVGSVAAALQVAKTAKPDALCLQGADAGGHGFEKGAGIISLVPEASDALAREGFSNISIIASGGIADGRGVAAALSLGAEGVVMGTRFLASKEVVLHPQYQAAILEAQDGGQVTTRSKLFDQLRGPNIWPVLYDGRSLVVKSYKDFVSGVSLEDIQKLHNDAKLAQDEGFSTGLQGRAAIWAGTGVGLVTEVEGAAEIVESVRTAAKKVLGKVSKF